MKTLRNLIGAAFCAAFFVSTTQAATNVWNQLATGGNASGSWNVPANPPWSQGFIPGVGDAADFSTLNITNSIVTLDADQSIDTMIFGDTTTTSAGNWIFSSGSGPYALTLSGTTPTLVVGALNSGSLVGLDVPLVGTAGFTKSGPGTLTLTNLNTFSGNVTVTGGTLGIYAGDAALGEIPASVTPDNITLDGGTLYNLRSGNFIISMSLAANRGITIGANGGTFRVNNAGTTMGIRGPITGSGNITKISGGTVSFNGDLSTFTGKFSATAATSGLIFFGVSPADPSTLIPDRVTFNNSGGLNNNNGIGSLVTCSIPPNFGITLAGTGTVQSDTTSGGPGITINSPITGPGILAKTGLGYLALNGVNTYAGGTTVAQAFTLMPHTRCAIELGNVRGLGSGTLTFNNTTNINGLRFTGAVITNGTVPNNVVFATVAGMTNRWMVDSGRSVTFSGVISGGNAASVWAKDTDGTLVITGTNTYTGTTAIVGGKMTVVTGGSCSNSAFAVLPLGNGGILETRVTDNTRQWTCASLTTITSFGTPGLEFTFSGPGSTTLAPLRANGAVTFANTPTVTVNAGNLGITTGNGYPLMTWGSVVGTPPTTAELTLNPPGTVGTLSVVGNTLYLQISATTQPLRWTAGTSTWDYSSLNWMDSAITPALVAFVDGSAVQFEDTQNASGGVITMDATLTPASVLVNSTNDYTLTGTSPSIIAGGGSLTKNGSGTLLIEGPGGNTFGGGVTINAGTVISAKPDGTPAGACGEGNVVVNGGRLIGVGSNSLFGIFTASGKALTINSGGTVSNTASSSGQLNRLIMNGGTLAAATSDPTFGSWGINYGVSTPGSGNTSTVTGGNLALGQSGGTVFNIGTGDTLNISASLDATPSSPGTGITKQGAGTLVLNGNITSGGALTLSAGTLTLNGVNSGSTASTLTSGTLRVGGNATMGTGTVSVATVTIASIDATTRTITNTLSFGTGASTTTFGNAGGTGKLVFTGPVSVATGGTGRTFTNSADVEFSGNWTLSNGGFVKRGPGIMTISGVSSTVWAGGLHIGGGAYLVNGTLNSATTLNATNGAIIGGTGTINAPIALGAGGILSPGASLGTLTVTNSPNWTNPTATVFMELNLTNSPNSDRLVRTSGGFSFTNGTLTVTNLGPALTNGSTFTLFSAGNTGTFATMNLPPLDVGLGWTFNASAGTLTVGPGVSTTPTNITWSLAGNQLNLTWPGTHLGWTLQAQTNGLGTGISNNWVDVAGTASGTNYAAPIDSTKPAVFYRLRYLTSP